jgi:ribosomal-protein-alanine N-acetyltransferase
MKLESSRLLFRPISYRDINVLLDILNDPLVAQYNDYGTRLSRDEIKALIQWDLEQMYLGIGLRYAVLLKSCKTVIGTLGVYDHNAENNTCNIGFELASTHWGKGIMYEALSFLIHNIQQAKTIFDGTLEIKAKVAHKNIRCKQLLERLKFQDVGAKSNSAKQLEYYKLTVKCTE